MFNQNRSFLMTIPETNETRYPKLTFVEAVGFLGIIIFVLGYLIAWVWPDATTMEEIFGAGFIITFFIWFPLTIFLHNRENDNPQEK